MVKKSNLPFRWRNFSEAAEKNFLRNKHIVNHIGKNWILDLLDKMVYGVKKQ